MYIPYLIIGYDIFSLAVFHHLMKGHGEESIILLSQQNLSQKDFTLKGPGLLRGKNNISYMREYNPHALTDDSSIPSIFYKDKAFHSFSDKPHPKDIQAEEVFFTQSRIDVQMDNLFPFKDDPLFLSSLKRRHIKYRISKIERYIHEESGEEINFRITHENGEITCRHLTWGYPPETFLSYCPDKRIQKQQHLPFSSMYILHVEFQLSSSFNDSRETLFFPLSHHQGYFIGEFKENGFMELASFLKKEESFEEDIIKKIKSLKRILEKIYPGFKNAITQERIALNEWPSFLNQDHLYSKTHSLDYMNFTGMKAPLPNSSDLSHLARGMESLRLICQSL